MWLKDDKNVKSLGYIVGALLSLGDSHLWNHFVCAQIDAFILQRFTHFTCGQHSFFLCFVPFQSVLHLIS